MALSKLDYRETRHAGKSEKKLIYKTPRRATTTTTRRLPRSGDRNGNLNLPTCGNSSRISADRLIRSSEVRKFRVSGPRARAYRRKIPRGAHAEYECAAVIACIRRGAHVQRNGSQILYAFVVTGVQRRNDRSLEICTLGCCAFARVASMNRPRIPRPLRAGR